MVRYAPFYLHLPGALPSEEVWKLRLSDAFINKHAVKDNYPKVECSQVGFFEDTDTILP